MELKLKHPLTLAKLSDLIDAKLAGEAATAASEQVITHIAKTLEHAGPGSIAFLANPLYKKFLAHTKATAVVLVAAEALNCPTATMISANPRLSLAKLIRLCYDPPVRSDGIHASVILGPDVRLGKDVAIGPYCVIGANTELADGVSIHAGVVIDENCYIGANSTLKSNVTLYSDVVLGANCTIHSNTVLGADGFGYEADAAGNWVKLMHLGGVVLGDNVEIGSSTTVDRGMLDNTIIGNNVIIDNQVQIAHNVIIGDNTAIAGCVAIAGSSSIGKNCLIGGAACIAGHLSIADRVCITGASAVSHSLTQPGIYSSGLPARENNIWRKNVARFMSLESMAKRIKELEKVIRSANNFEDIQDYT